MILEQQLLARRNRDRELTGFPWDVVASEGIDVEGLRDRCALDQMRDKLVYRRILFVAVALGILLTLPKTQGKELVGLGIRHEENLVHESRLVFKDREDLVVNGLGKSSHFSRLGPDGDHSAKHSVPPFGHPDAEPTLDKFEGSIVEEMCEAQAGSSTSF
jgi:hypothetical protein